MALVTGGHIGQLGHEGEQEDRVLKDGVRREELVEIQRALIVQLSPHRMQLPDLEIWML